MSLLMEALRKAEEAKSKAEQTNIDSPIDDNSQAAQLENESISINEPPDSNPETIKFEPSPIIEKTPEKNIEDVEYFSQAPANEFEEKPEPITSSDANSDLATNESVSTFDEPISSELQNEYESDIEEPLQESNASITRPHHRQNNKGEDDNKQAINSLFQAKISSQRQRKRKYRAASAALILAFIFAGGAFWYFSPPTENQYNIPSNFETANRGFLDDAVVETNIENNLEGSSELTLTELTNDLNEEVVTSEDNPTTVDEGNGPFITATDNTTEVDASTSQESQTNIDEQVFIAQERDTISFTRSKPQAALNPQISAAFSTFQSGNYPEAMVQYQKALGRQPNDRDAMLGLASIYMKQGNASLAQEMYIRMLRLNPQDPIARAGIMESSFTNDPLRQESELKTLIEIHPDLAPLSFALGNLYASQNRWNEAQNSYFFASMNAKTSNVGPISPDYAFNLAVSLERLNQPRSAYIYYQEARELSQYSTSGFEQDLLARRIEYLEKNLP